MEKDLNKKLSHLKKGLEDLTAQFMEITELGEESMKERGEAALEEVKERVQKTAKMAQARAQQIDDFAYENPWLVAAIAAGVAFVVGSLLKHSKRS
jgi:ElaB/YqjD/DUF883 family membrane-anchored ribosome-binding protein